MERRTNERESSSYAHPVKGGVTINKGEQVALEGGFAVPGKQALNLVPVGRAEQTVNNADGADGDATVVAKRGTFNWGNGAGADEISRADIGSDCFMAGPASVAKTDGGGTRSRAGVVEDVEGGVWVTADART